jgi:ABC-type Zn uptake system ZnuABC Zn-binding protein ZnuA
MSACGGQPTPNEIWNEHIDVMPVLEAVPLEEDEGLRVVATTSIVGDVVMNVGGDQIDLTVLVPLGTDPHTFEPTPQDAVAVADANVVFANGVGLETFLEPLLESAGEGIAVVPVSFGVELLQLEEEHAHEGEGNDNDDHAQGDPHTWFDPSNVMIWTDNIEDALSNLDPNNTETYLSNAETYQAELDALDGWIREQVAQIPEGNRRLVTDHASFSYLAHRYGLEQIGTIFPGYSTLAEPSAQDIARLEDAIDQMNVPAVFVGLTVSPDLAEQVAADTGTQIVFLYTGSLSEPGGPATDYLSLMRFNITALVDALR